MYDNGSHAAGTATLAVTGLAMTTDLLTGVAVGAICLGALLIALHHRTTIQREY